MRFCCFFAKVPRQTSVFLACRGFCVREGANGSGPKSHKKGKKPQSPPCNEPKLVNAGSAGLLVERPII